MNRLEKAFELFDEENSMDPNKEDFNGKMYPKELLYSMRMTDKLNEYAPDASDSLKLAARCQHICRWKIPRESYDMDRTGYLRWRNELKKFHAEEASKILEKVGYSDETISQVRFLLQKKQLKKSGDTQLLEDVICLVFLEHYFEPFALRHSEEKVIGILQKTWGKMSEKGQKAALGLTLSKKSLSILNKALEA
ncbi:DUF4202 domain-containing protein [Maribacter sp. MMG018]|uniref:DUF4202 domain-containing protein n=1 Tax=Maribacter sp. MMG018 TaxID=2822688 RepID=UPI001B396999|nr:DUF4202 domain-containing protein [Maribacter sp. MMG018]MBQ4913935.1 DUF4202 domain-containing protein [Maribacter sp. MMG018]